MFPGEVVGGELVGGEVTGGEVVGGVVGRGEVVGGEVGGGTLVVGVVVEGLRRGMVVVVVDGVSEVLVVEGVERCEGESCKTPFATGKSDTGYWASAGFMKAAQISAGKLPPSTSIPCTSVMGTLPCG